MKERSPNTRTSLELISSVTGVLRWVSSVLRWMHQESARGKPIKGDVDLVLTLC